MKMTFAQTRDIALALGKNDRRKLLRELTLSLDGPPKADDESRLMTEDMTKEEFDAELLRRMEEAKRDPSVMIDFDEAMKKWRKLCR